MPEPRVKKPAHEADAFRPSSFASRKAKAERANDLRKQKRIVSLGHTTYTQKNMRTGELEHLEAELFCNLDKPIERWVSIPGQPGLHPMQDNGSGHDDVTRTRLSRPLGRPTGAFPEAPVEQPARPV